MTQILHVRKAKRGFGMPVRGLNALTAVLSLLSLDCNQPVEAPVTPDLYKAQVSGFSVVYDRVTDRARLSWTPPAEEVTLYSLERSGPDNVVEQKIPGDSAAFSDVLDLINGSYVYVITPLRVDGRDTLAGLPSQPGVCRAAPLVYFNINHGDAYAIVPQCKLWFYDSTSIEAGSPRPVSVTFTQKLRHYLVNDSVVNANLSDDSAMAANIGKKFVNLVDYDSLPSDAVINQLIAENWIDADAQFKAYIRKKFDPDFDAADPDNPNRTLVPGGTVQSEFDWVLKQGNGTKLVYAQVRYDDGTFDTLKAEISIKPYKIRVKMRNNMSTGDLEMRHTVNPPDAFGSIREDYVLNPPLGGKPWRIKFSVQIDGDTTFAEDFDYWIITKNTWAEFSATGELSVIDSSRQILESAARSDRLTGQGPMHDDSYVYEYSIDPSEELGRQNLRETRLTKRIPSGTVLPLAGTGALNELAVPGSYWGANPKAWVKGEGSAPGGVQEVQEIYRISAADNSARLRALTRSHVYIYGKKEFTIVCRFKGRHFNDTRVMLAGSFILRSRLGASRYALTWLDAYPPAAIPVSIDANERIDNGDTLTSTFDFYLDNGSIVDKGGSRVSDVRLLISKCPAGQRWDYWNWTGDTIPPVTLAQMLQSVHTIIPYQVRVPDVTVNSVKWEDIIPTEWESGDYYLGVYTSDEFGNSGLAPMAFDGGFYTNPLKVTVISGK